jgi:hypothetical protein
MIDLSCAIFMRAPLRLSLHVEILIINSIILFSQKPSELLDDCFTMFEFIMSSIRSCGLLTYFDNECAKQLLYVLDDSV